MHPNWSIDIFLELLAEAKGKKSIAIILSGTGSDGSKGAALGKKAGGIIIVQDLESCEHCDMPSNAIKTGAVDYVLPPSEMPPVVLQPVSNIIKNASLADKLMNLAG